MYENCDPRHLCELLWKSGYIILNLWEKQWERDTLHNILLHKGHCATETTQGTKEHHGRVLQTFGTEHIIITIKLDQPCEESNLFTKTHLHTSQSWYRSIAPRKTFKLCHTFPSARILHHVFFSVSTLKEKRPGTQIQHPFSPPTRVCQCLDHIPTEDYKHAFEQWIQRLKKCVAAQGAYFEKDTGTKARFKVSERYFKSIVSFIPTL